MNNRPLRLLPGLALAGLVVFGTLVSPAAAQNFDFKSLAVKVRPYTVIVDMDLDISFGVHSNQQSERYLGTIVTADGLVMFDGSALSTDAGISAFSGVTVKTVPSKVEVTTLDGKTYDGDYVGLDRFTGIGFLRIKADSGVTFTPIQFKKDAQFTVGDWLGVYMLLPEFVTPPLAGDVGMVSALVTSPQNFTLTVGFNALEVTSVLYDADLEPVGVLGSLQDPSSSGDAGNMMESLGQFGVPLLGVITADQLNKLIADPPVQGEVDRGWLGITLQALTKDIANFWGLKLSGGIIVNDIVKGSPAETAGLKVGDILYSVNGQDVDVDKDEKIPVFQRMISEMGSGAQVELGVIRREEKKTDTLSLLATLGEAPINASDAPEYDSKTLEFKVRDMVFADYMIINQDPEHFHGAVVSELKMGGLADVGGLQIGDIIQRIGSSDIASVGDVQVAMEQIEKTKPSEVIFFVWRNKKTLFVNVKTDWQK